MIKAKDLLPLGRRAAGTSPTPSGADPLVDRALRLIRQRLGRLPPIEELAAGLGVDRSTLHRRFRRVLGMSVRDAIREIRLAEARRLLLDTQWPITRIALAVGYSSPAKLADQFREHLGTSPTEFRRVRGGGRSCPKITQ